MGIRAYTHICRAGLRRSGNGPACRHAGASRREQADAEGRPRAALHTEGFTEAAPLPAPGRAMAAVRAFSAGNGYLSGQIIDRLL